MRKRDTRRFIVAILTIIAYSISLAAREPLSFMERVTYCEAIERVCHDHRIWPKDNPSPKPLFHEVMRRDVVIAKVNDGLRKSVALEVLWKRPILTKQLQAEMDRMAMGTQDPAMLKELFGACDNDPIIVAECLVRPILADRLIRNWYAFDSRFHGRQREAAEKVLALLTSDQQVSNETGQRFRIRYVVESVTHQDIPLGLDPQSDARVVYLHLKDWEEKKRELEQKGRISGILEDKSAFSISITRGVSPTYIELDVFRFKKKDFVQWWGAVSERLPVFCSYPISGAGDLTLPLVGRPASSSCKGQWAVNSLNSTPEPRNGHTSVWTGSEMIVWGGRNGMGILNSGGRYSPATDTWKPTPTGDGCPSARSGHSSVWTGSKMIVWGGSYRDSTGGLYDPVLDAWAPTSTGEGCPSIGPGQTAVWTGSEMIAWGGRSQEGDSNAGGRYDPIGDIWVPTSQSQDCPLGRENHTCVWTGGEMIVWGGEAAGHGRLQTGGIYHPETDSWRETSTGDGCPSNRRYHSAVGTGSEMIIWGGEDGVDSLTKTGGRYNPASDTWAAINEGEGCPESRKNHSAVWTNQEMIIWGGSAGGHYPKEGGRYDPETDAWHSTSTGPGCPEGTTVHSAVWTGEEMIVWGGYDDAYLNTGGRYDPLLDSWIPGFLDSDQHWGAPGIGEGPYRRLERGRDDHLGGVQLCAPRHNLYEYWGALYPEYRFMVANLT